MNEYMPIRSGIVTKSRMVQCVGCPNMVPRSSAHSKARCFPCKTKRGNAYYQAHKNVIKARREHAWKERLQ